MARSAGGFGCLGERGMDFLVIDFETATKSFNSACSVAVVDIRDGVVADSFHALIRPPQMKFLPANIEIHGITPAMVQGERDFAGIWPELESYLRGRIVVAHNAAFDMSVLRESLKANHLSPPPFYQCCTVQIARRVWPDLPNHKLNTVGAFLHIPFRHHDALEDARVCAAIPLAAAKEQGVADMPGLAEKIQVKIRPFAGA